MNKNKMWFVSAVLILSMGILAACAKAPVVPTDMATMETDTPAVPTVGAASETLTPDPGTVTPEVTVTSSGGDDFKVEIEDFAFVSDTLTVKVGTTVTWTNKDNVGHTATSDTGVFDSGMLQKGESFSFTFTKAGTYPYFCTPHPYMVATIVVTE